jgi:hypothetical protein
MNTNVFDAPYAKVTYEPHKRLLVLIWSGNPMKDEYKKPFLAMQDFGRKYPVDSMLTDITKQGVVSPENRKWFENEMVPKAVEAGLKQAAIVTDGNAFKLYYLNIILSAVRKFPMTTKLFNDRQEALTWLESFPVSTYKME